MLADEDPAVRPAPLVCPACGLVKDEWVWCPELKLWEFDDEWWKDPARPSEPLGYTCSGRCYGKRLTQPVQGRQ